MSRERWEACLSLLTRRPAALFTDVEGTLCPGPWPLGRTQVSPRCRQSLAALARRLELVAAITEHPAQEVYRLLGIPEMVYAGGYGLDWWVSGFAELSEGHQAFPGALAEALTRLAPKLEAAGVFLQNRGVMASLYYDLGPSPEATREFLLSTLAQAPEARPWQVREGRGSIELWPPVLLSKAIPVVILKERYLLRGALYLGNSREDLEAFCALHDPGDADFRGMTVAVRGQETPPELIEQADFVLEGIPEAEAFLSWLEQSLPG